MLRVGLFLNYFKQKVKYICLFVKYVLHLLEPKLKTMKPGSFLLPHYFQKIGWGLFVFSFIFLFGSLFAFNTLKLFNQNNSHYATLILVFILIFSAFFVAFSKEKNEDELILKIRYSSVVITAYLGFIIYMIMLIIFQINRSFELFPGTSAITLAYLNPLTMFLIYIVVLRTRLFIFYKLNKNEE